MWLYPKAKIINEIQFNGKIRFTLEEKTSSSNIEKSFSANSCRFVLFLNPDRVKYLFKNKKIIIIIKWEYYCLVSECLSSIGT